MSQSGVYDNNASGLPTVDTLTGNNSSVHVPPDASNNINIVGTGGVNVTGNAGTNTLTISVNSEGFTFTDKSTSFSAAAENGYFVTGTATASLPASPSQGDTIIFMLDTASILTIQANTGQTIQYSTTTSSSAGTLVSTMTGDSMTLVYRAADTKWKAQSFVGNWGST